MIHKYNLNALLDKFSFSVSELVSFINLGILIPDGFNPDNFRADLNTYVWSFQEVDRFESIIHLIKDKHFDIYKTLNSRINEFSATTSNHFESVFDKFLDLKQEIRRLNSYLERRQIMIDAKYFCGITGYKIQTFRNNIKIIDEKGLMMRLNINFYQDLVWHKIKGKWQTPIQDFEKLRTGFHYELWIEEKKRLGEFQPRMKIND